MDILRYKLAQEMLVQYCKFTRLLITMMMVMIMIRLMRRHKLIMILLGTKIARIPTRRITTILIMIDDDIAKMCVLGRAGGLFLLLQTSYVCHTALRVPKRKPKEPKLQAKEKEGAETQRKGAQTRSKEAQSH